MTDILYTISVWLIPLVVAITFHEAAHGWVADRLGDDTARRLGRITLNPIRHIDRFGTLILPGLLLLMQAPFIFGYAKPVPVNFSRLGAPKRDMIWVALAGPGANLVQAIGWTVLFYVLLAGGVEEEFFLKMCQAGLLVNLVMFAFNLFPLPPLDGGRILVGLLPWKQAELVSRVEPWGFFIVMALVISGVVGNLWLRPLMMLTGSAIEVLLTPIRLLLL